MIYQIGFQIDKKLKEILPDSFSSFSCLCKRANIPDIQGGFVPWHWHQPFEIDYVRTGSVRVRNVDTDMVLRQGEAVFLNSNVLHSFIKNGDEAGEVDTIFFDAEFLSGGYGTVFSENYISPVTSAHAFLSYTFVPQKPEDVRMLSLFLDIVDLFEKEPPGYEWDVRTLLGKWWLLMMRATEELRGSVSRSSHVDSVRIKQMISFIEEHYPEKISLQDIAEAAGISSRECSRCFARTIGHSPVDYLNTYRLRQAAGMILETGDPIGLIAEKCGFLSDSYFGKAFREMTGCTPREYRAQGKRHV